MRFIEQLSAASALVTLVSSSPVEVRASQANQAFSIPQNIPKPFILSGPALNLNVYAKYHATAPADVIAAAANNDGTVTATPQEYDSEVRRQQSWLERLCN